MNAFLRKLLRLLAVIAVVALALGLRLRAVERLPIDYDEDDYLLAAQHYAAALVQGDWAEIAGYEYNLEHPPLAKLVYGAVLSYFPQAPEIPALPTSAAPAASLPEPQFLALRLTAALQGTLAVLTLALIDPLAGLFLGVHTFTIKYTSQVMLEALPALTSLLAALAYLRSRGRARGRFDLWLGLSGALLGLTAAAKYLYAVVGLAILLHWLWSIRRLELRRASAWLPALAWGGVSLAVFFAADPYLWPDPLGRLQASILFNTGYAAGEQVQNAGLPFWQPLSWLFQSVPWHPGVFLFTLDALIALLALAGLKRAWAREPFFVFWLATAFGFLLLWPTKWAQYTLVLTAPLSLVAAEGARARLWEPFSAWRRRPKRLALPRFERRAWELRWREVRRALPWLLPGTLALGLIAVFPLVYQAAMALTDFQAVAIRDGLNGGVWREVWLGLSGQVEPVVVEPFSRSFTRVTEVHYAGTSLLTQVIFGFGGDILVFEALWTVLSVALQLALGLGVALLLQRRGVLFKRWWGAILILPWAIPEFVGALIWGRMFDPRFGWFLQATSFAETPGYPLASPLASWQDQPNIALLILLVAATWYGFPLMMLAASAALKMLPAEVYDAAQIDGAGRWAQFRYITWPMVLPLLAPAMILRAIFAFNQFYLFYVLNAPFPLITLASLSYFVFDANSGYGGQFALSAAINVFTVIVLALLLLWFNRWSRSVEGVTYA